MEGSVKKRLQSLWTKAPTSLVKKPVSFHSPKLFFIFLKTLFSYLTLFGTISFFKYINTKFKGGTLIQNLKGVFAKVKGPGVKLNHKKTCDSIATDFTSELCL